MFFRYQKGIQTGRMLRLLSKHQDCKAHQEAVEAIVTLLKTSANVGELLS